MDPLTTNNVIHLDLLTFSFTIYNKTVNLRQRRTMLKGDGKRNRILKNDNKTN